MFRSPFSPEMLPFMEEERERETRQIRRTAGTRRGSFRSNAIISKPKPACLPATLGNRYLSGNRHEVRINLSEVGEAGESAGAFAFETRTMGYVRRLKNSGITIRLRYKRDVSRILMIDTYMYILTFLLWIRIKRCNVKFYIYICIWKLYISANT